MQKLFGIIPTKTGTYAMATVAASQSSTTVLVVRELPEHAILRNIALLHHGIILGIPCAWSQKDSALNNGECAAQWDSNFLALCRTAELEIHRAALEDNLLGAVGNDAFLATIPLALLDNPADSFIAVYAADDACRIAVIARKKLQVCFTMAPAHTESMRGHVQRIRHYCNRNNLSFPSQIYLLGDKARYDNAALGDNVQHISLGSALDKDENALMAAGAALSQKMQAVPRFCNASEKSQARTVRSASYIASAATIACSIIAAALGWGLEAAYENRLNTYEEKYHHAIKNNTEINELLTKSNDLAERVSGLEQTFSQQTPWGRLLDYLGRDCPKGIYIEKLGSQPDEKDSSALRIALSGWTENEASVTDCISKLQKMPFLSKVSLASMERAKKKKNISLFRIVCSLDLHK